VLGGKNDRGILTFDENGYIILLREKIKLRERIK